MLEKTLESPLDCKEIQPVNPKGNQSWMFIGRTDAEAETPILWSPDGKNWSLEKTLMLGKTEGRKEKEMAGWDGWMASPTWWTWVWVNSRSWWWTGKPGIYGVAKSRIRLSNWTELNVYLRRFTIIKILMLPISNSTYNAISISIPRRCN